MGPWPNPQGRLRHQVEARPGPDRTDVDTEAQEDLDVAGDIETGVRA